MIAIWALPRCLAASARQRGRLAEVLGNGNPAHRPTVAIHDIPRPIGPADLKDQKALTQKEQKRIK